VDLNKPKVYAYGAGAYFFKIADELKKKYEIVAVIDKNSSKQGQLVSGIPCISNDVLRENGDVPIIITCIDERSIEEIREEIKRAKCIEKSIYSRNSENAKSDEVIVFGSIEECRMLDIWIACNTQETVISYCTMKYNEVGVDKPSGKQIVSYISAQRMIREKTATKIISYIGTYDIEFVPYLFEQDIVQNHLYVFNDEIKGRYSSGWIQINEYRRIGCLQFMLTPSCNLNCKLCSYFSPLVKESIFYDLNRFESDLQRLRLYVDHIDSLDLWGGESLLCPDLPKYIYKAREYFPDSNINVGTNGLLLSNISDELIYAMKKTKARFLISVYPPLRNSFDKIFAGLKEKNIEYFAEYAHLSCDPDKTVFFRRYDLSGENNHVESWELCESKRCHTIFEGMISGCYFPIVSKYFNEYFDGQFFNTSDDVIDIYRNMSTKEFLSFLRSPMNSCKYCHLPIYEKWKTIGKKSEISDWVI